MGEGEKGLSSDESQYAYSIRVWVNQSQLPVEEISAALDRAPDYSRELGELEKYPASMWCSVTWTKGERDFFGEVHDVLVWLQERSAFLDRLKLGGGELHVVAQLHGGANIGSSMRPETALLAAQLGVLIGVEVFPRLSGGEGPG